MSNTLELHFSRLFDTLALEMNARAFSSVHILAAVSGGADSIALLCLLERFSHLYQYQLSVVTVNHLIRSEEESSGDARFVAELCASFVPPVLCQVVNLQEGEVDREAASRGKGIEEAARFLRYRHFEEIAEKTGASLIMTGHTRTDQLETILMRFFQGTGGGALGGIAARRGKYLRPLLSVSRVDIIEWLTREGFSWREDATNSDDEYLRNKIRLHLVPMLTSLLPGWETGVLTAASKALLDDDLCRSMITVEWKRSGARIHCQSADYIALHPALRLRFLQNGLNLLSVDHRIPYGYLKRIVDAPSVWQKTGVDTVCLSGSKLRFVKEGETLFWGPDIVQNTKTGYLIYIYTCGRYHFPFGTITVSGENDAVFLDGRLGPFSLPLTVRSRMGGDTVSTADRKQKTLKKLMNDWSVSESDRELLPLVEQAGLVRAVYGSVLGYPDWYVQN